MIKTGQLRRWRDDVPDEERIFIVLDRCSIPMPGADWVENGWWILVDGRPQWIYECDIEDDSEIIGTG